MRQIEWHLLETFRVVGRLEHVSRAAAELGTSQPAISRALARLENVLGEPLFDRLGRSIVLTRKGRLFLQAVERSHEDLEEAHDRLFGQSERVPRAVALGFLRTLGTRAVPHLLQKFRRHNPTVPFSFSQNNTTAIEEALEGGDIDLGLTAVPSHRASIGSEWLFNQELVLIAARTHRLANKKLVRLTDVAREPFVMFKAGHAFRTLIEQLCSAAGFRPEISFEGDDSNSVPGFVAAGFGVAVVPSDMTLPPNVAVLATAGPLVRRPIGISWMEGRHLHAQARLFREFVVDVHRNRAHTP